MNMSLIKKYLLYLFRWQLSTPILAVVTIWLASAGEIVSAIVANFIGGLIFFWIDGFIFKKIQKEPLWEIKDNVECVQCKKVGRGYRIVEWLNYDRSNDINPQYRCETCKNIKFKEVKAKATAKKGLGKKK